MRIQLYIRDEDFYIKIDFIMANPPASTNDDGFSYRRRILNEASEYLSKKGIIFLNISSQYGVSRINGLDNGGYISEGVLETSCWEEFDLDRTDLYDCIKEYAKEENRGGNTYEFYNTSAKEIFSANDAFSNYEKTGKMPYTKWQVYLFRLK